MPQRALARNRQELSSFVRRQREQLKPGDVGLPITGRRRTAGLRREEVAALAGVGLTWYTWFEQGRDVNVSAAFLDNVARALHLDAAGRAHLFLLSGQPAPEPAISAPKSVPPGLQDMIDAMRGRPAYVKDARWQILAWNAAARFVFGDFSRIPARERNSLRLAFVDSPFRRAMTNGSAPTMPATPTIPACASSSPRWKRPLPNSACCGGNTRCWTTATACGRSPCRASARCSSATWCFAWRDCRS
jgi:transcriptional regulator with XRE-family HTH domain